MTTKHLHRWKCARCGHVQEAISLDVTGDNLKRVSVSRRCPKAGRYVRYDLADDQKSTETAPQRRQSDATRPDAVGVAHNQETAL